MKRIATVLALAFGAGAAFADDIPDPVKWSLKEPVAARALKRGEKITARVTAQVERGWHLYSLSQPEGGPIATRIWLPENQPFRAAGAVSSPKPKTSFDANFDREIDYYEGQAGFAVPLQVAGDAAGGRQKITISARFQSCNSQLCLPPRTVKLQSEVEVAAPKK